MPQRQSSISPTKIVRSIFKRAHVGAFALCVLLVAPHAVIAAEAQTTSQSTLQSNPETKTEQSAQQNDANPSDASAASQEPATEAYQPLRDIKGSGKYLIDRDGLILLGSGIAVLALARNFDEEAADAFRGHQRLSHSTAEIGNEFLGTGLPGVLIGGGFWIYGDLMGKSYHSHAGQAQLETMLITSIVTSALKGSVGRERPDTSDRYAWPSGHVSTVFASASVLHQFYGWKAGAVAYSLGALTAASRMSSNRHWLSDTVGGALIGLVVGRAISKSHLERAGTGVTWQIRPSIDERGTRAVVEFTY